MGYPDDSKLVTATSGTAYRGAGCFAAAVAVAIYCFGRNNIAARTIHPPATKTSFKTSSDLPQYPTLNRT
jgi:hypothetical protein